MGNIIDVPHDRWGAKDGDRKILYRLPKLADQVIRAIKEGRYDEVDLPEDAALLLHLAFFIAEETNCDPQGEGVEIYRVLLRDWNNSQITDALWGSTREMWRESPDFFQALIYAIDERELIVL